MSCERLKRGMNLAAITHRMSCEMLTGGINCAAIAAQAELRNANGRHELRSNYRTGALNSTCNVERLYTYKEEGTGAVMNCRAQLEN